MSMDGIARERIFGENSTVRLHTYTHTHDTYVHIYTEEVCEHRHLQKHGH